MRILLFKQQILIKKNISVYHGRKFFFAKRGFKLVKYEQLSTDNYSLALNKPVTEEGGWELHLCERKGPFSIWKITSCAWTKYRPFLYLRTHYPSRRTFFWSASFKTSNQESSSRRIMRLVPVFILETHNQTNYKCWPKFVQTDNASSSIKTAIRFHKERACDGDPRDVFH